MNRLVEVLERPEPTMAVPFAEPMSEAEIAEIAAVADVAELRADLFPSQDQDYLAEQAGRLALKPILLTVRDKSESGDQAGFQDTEQKRLELLTTPMPGVEGIDVELAAEIRDEAIEAAHDMGRIVVASSHDFTGTPETPALEEKLAEGREAGADYIKFAATAENLADYRRLADFTLEHKAEPIIVVAMGRYGPLSRIVLPRLGSRLTYAAGKQAVAPGQLGYQETHDYFANIYRNWPKRLELDTQEIEVLERISLGNEPEESDRELFATAKTAQNFKRGIFSKLGARNTPSAVRIGFETGILVPRQQPHSDYLATRLSPVELNDLELASLGFTYKEAGKLRGVSSRTVDGARLHILQKLNANNVAYAVRLAIEAGVLKL